MSYSDEHTMSEYIDGLESIFNRLEVMDSSVSDYMQVTILLARFGSKHESPYGVVVTALQTMSDDDLTWERAASRLLQEYSTINALNNKRKVPRSMEESVHQKALKRKAHIQCFECGRYGHYNREYKASCKHPRQEGSYLKYRGTNRHDCDDSQRAMLVRETTEEMAPVFVA